MAIIVIVEDGSNVPNANGYITVPEARSYAEQRGVTLSEDDDVVAAMIINATDYLQSFGCQYMGVPTYFDQSLQWPRTGVNFCGVDYPNDAIPKNLKSAQAAGVIAISQGFSLLQTISPSDYVIEDTVGPITTKYASPVDFGIETQFKGIDALLAGLFGDCGQVSGFRTYRV